MLAPVLLLEAFGNTAAAAPKTPANASRRAGDSSLPSYDIILLSRGHYNRLYLPATVEGTKGLFVVDTGAEATLLNSERYNFLLTGPNRQPPPGVPATSSVNGIKCPVAVAHQFRIGNTDLGRVVVRLIPGRYLYDQALPYERDSARQYDGMLGEDFLRRYRAVLNCGRVELYLNTNPTHMADIGPMLIRAGWTRVPMSDLHDNFVVPCEIDGHQYRLVVDSGSPFTQLDKSMLLSARVTMSDAPLRGGVIGTPGERMGLGKLDALRIGDYTAARTPVLAATQTTEMLKEALRGTASGAPILGLLGGDFLAHNLAIVDIGGHALYLRHAGATTTGTPR